MIDMDFCFFQGAAESCCALKICYLTIIFLVATLPFAEVAVTT